MLIHYLCHLLTTNGISPNLKRSKPSLNSSHPEIRKVLENFLEWLNTTENSLKFINIFADAARPLTKLTRRNVKFEWSPDCQTGFEYLKNSLTKDKILKYPDPSKRYVIFADASYQAAAAALTQECPDENGKIMVMPTAYLSAQFSDTQFKWNTIVKEGYAIYYAVKKWWHYLEDAEILLKSNVKSLQKFLKGRTNNVKLYRWSLELQGRNITVEHIPGSKNKAVDCLPILPFDTRKRNDNPLNNVNFLNEPITALTHTSMSIDHIRPEGNDAMYRLCEIDLTDTIAQQKTDKHCIRLVNLMKNKDSKFPDRDKYAKEEGLLYLKRIKRMARNTKQLLYLRPLHQQYSKKCMTHLDILA